MTERNEHSKNKKNLLPKKKTLRGVKINEYCKLIFQKERPIDSKPKEEKSKD